VFRRAPQHALDARTQDPDPGGVPLAGQVQAVARVGRTEPTAVVGQRRPQVEVLDVLTGRVDQSAVGVDTVMLSPSITTWPGAVSSAANCEARMSC
jgi:hypothetical protein